MSGFPRVPSAYANTVQLSLQKQWHIPMRDGKQNSIYYVNSR